MSRSLFRPTRPLTVSLLLAAVAAGCGGSEQQMDKVVDTLQQKAKDLGSSVDPYRQKALSLAEGELGKLYKIEYRVVEFDEKMPVPDLEKELVRLGEERWDCSALPGSDKIRLICKRLPLNVLKLLV